MASNNEKTKIYKVKITIEEVEEAKKLCRMSEDLFEISNYFIKLFYKAGKKYTCSRRKLSKLISILAFDYARKGYMLFNNDLYRYPDCGTSIPLLEFKIPKDVYLEWEYYDEKKVITPDELVSKEEVPKCYSNIGSLWPKVQHRIEEVFYNFGAYSSDELSKCLNPIVESDGVCFIDGRIDMEQIAKMDLSKLRTFKDSGEVNEVVAFLSR